MTAQFHEWLLHEHGRLEPYPLVSPVALCCAAPAIQQSIDISYLLGPQQQTRHTLLEGLVHITKSAIYASHRRVAR